MDKWLSYLYIKLCYKQDTTSTAWFLLVYWSNHFPNVFTMFNMNILSDVQTREFFSQYEPHHFGGHVFHGPSTVLDSLYRQLTRPEVSDPQVKTKSVSSDEQVLRYKIWLWWSCQLFKLYKYYHIAKDLLTLHHFSDFHHENDNKFKVKLYFKKICTCQFL